MNTISSAAFRRLSLEEINERLPFLVTYNGAVSFAVGSPDKTIVMDDLSLPVRAQLKAKEALARSGMPSPNKIYETDIYLKPSQRSPGE